jgi:hypothetical protein
MSQQGTTCKVRYYDTSDEKIWKEMQASEKESEGEVEIGAILIKGALLTVKGTLKEPVRREIEKQLEAEDGDRMITD